MHRISRIMPRNLEDEMGKIATVAKGKDERDEPNLCPSAGLHIKEPIQNT